MKIHWGYIGKYIVLTTGHIRIFEKKNEPARTEKDWIKSLHRLEQEFQLAIFSSNNGVNFNSNYDTAPTQGWWNIFSRL